MHILPEGGSATSTSAFAFQGTNAHIVLAPSAVQLPAQMPSEPSYPRQAALWQFGRYWYIPPPHSLLTCFTWHGAHSQQARWDLQLNQSKHSFLRDHQVWLTLADAPAWNASAYGLP